MNIPDGGPGWNVRAVDTPRANDGAPAALPPVAADGDTDGRAGAGGDNIPAVFADDIDGRPVPVGVAILSRCMG